MKNEVGEHLETTEKYDSPHNLIHSEVCFSQEFYRSGMKNRPTTLTFNTKMQSISSKQLYWKLQIK